MQMTLNYMPKQYSLKTTPATDFTIFKTLFYLLTKCQMILTLTEKSLPPKYSISHNYDLTFTFTLPTRVNNTKATKLHFKSIEERNFHEIYQLFDVDYRILSQTTTNLINYKLLTMTILIYNICLRITIRLIDIWADELHTLTLPYLR